MKPFLIISIILGGFSGLFIFQLFDVGLVAIPSPGSILLFAGLAPKEDILFILLGISLSAFVSFLCSMLLLKPASDSIDLVKLKKEPTPTFSNATKVRNILFICEAGMGSSAMGAAMLKKKLEQANLSIEVGNSSISEIPDNADLIVCHQKFLSVVQKTVPNKPCYPLKSFTDMKGYNDLIEKIRGEYS